ncbi:MAG: zinc-binding dehydrogenase [candidate division NC10 bacterium]|nr:zinc-binding dehydrogenase [candidate division NC10 bacterium]
MGGIMRGVLLRGPQRMSLEELPRPVPRSDQVLVRVRYSACCATDFDLIDGTMPDQAKYPIILGHEWSGQVVEAPPEHAALVGKNIVADNLVTCGICPACVGGRPNLCRRMDELGFSLNGSHAEYLVTLARSVRVLPSGLSPKAAALAEPVGVALYGTRRARVGLGDRVVVLGAGPIGLFTMQVCRAAGAAEVWQADLRPERLELAQRLGATGLLDLSKGSLAEALAEAKIEPDVIMECSGNPKAFAQAIKMVRPGGRVGVLGYYGDELAEIRPSDIMMRDLEVLGSVCPTGAWDAALALIADGRVNAEVLITHTFPLERFAEAYEIARHGTGGAVKVMLEIGGTD